MKKVDMYDDLVFPNFGQFPAQPNMKIKRSDMSSSFYRIRFTGPIMDDIEYYAEELEVFETASERDVILMELSSPGGSLETTAFLVSALRECQAHIVAKIGLTCASGCSAIALQADEFIVGPQSTMMIHSLSTSVPWMKEYEIRQNADITARINRDFVLNTYQNMLTTEELNRVLEDGKDLWFFGEDLGNRLEQYLENRELEEELFAEEQEAAYLEMQEFVKNKLAEEEIEEQPLTKPKKSRTKTPA